jgi:hypothetical protein
MSITQIVDFVKGFFSHKAVRLAIVRRYVDANGSYVGELYMEQTQGGISSYRMIGASLDTLVPQECVYDNASVYTSLGAIFDTKHDFLYPMPSGIVRVGSLDPKSNDSVRRMIANLSRHIVSLVVQNRFIEHVLEKSV